MCTQHNNIRWLGNILAEGCPVNLIDFAYVYEGRTAKATVSTTGSRARPAWSEPDAKLERDFLDHPAKCRQPFVFNHQAKAEIGWRHAGGAAARAGIPDEVGHVGPVRALHDANAAIGVGDLRGPVRSQRHAEEAGIGPFPDVTTDVVEAVLVTPERAGRLGLNAHYIEVE